MNRTYRLSDVVNERFLRLPLSLFANPNYKRLSAESKLVYSLLLDRMSLSQKNNWINEDGEVYFKSKDPEAPITANQIKFFYKVCSNHGLTKGEAKALLKDHGYDSASKVLSKDFDALLDALEPKEDA